MKLNKKIFAGALALAMGLGAVAPGVKSYAANETTTTVTEVSKEDAYKNAGEAWLAAYKNLEEHKKTKKDAEADVEKAKNNIIKYEANIEEYNAKIEELEDEKDEDGNKVDNSKEIEKLKKLRDADQVHLDDAEKDREKAQATLDKTYEYTDEEGKTHKATLNKTIKALEEIEENKREAFVEAGATEELMKAAIKDDKIEVPDFSEEPEEDETTKKIRKQLQVNKDKLSGIKVVKEMMPESYKRYKDTIDEAIENAEKAIKNAEAYLESLEEETPENK